MSAAVSLLPEGPVRLGSDAHKTLRKAIELNAFEEGRHILFFVNWAAWHRRTMPLWRRPFFELKVLAVWLFLIWERIGIARDVGHGA